MPCTDAPRERIRERCLAAFKIGHTIELAVTTEGELVLTYVKAEHTRE